MVITIGIAIPCYDAHISHLTRLLDSIELQTRKPDHVVVSCSSSTIDQIKDKSYSFKLTIIVSKNKQNAAINRNLCIQSLETDIISFFDADDIMHPQRTEIIRDAFSKTKCQILLHSHISPEELIKGDDFTTYNINNIPIMLNNLCKGPTGCAHWINPLLNKDNLIITHGMVSVAKALIQQYNFIFPEEKEHQAYNEDTLFCGQVLEKNPINAFIPLKLCKYYQSTAAVELKTLYSVNPVAESSDSVVTNNTRIFIFWTGNNPMTLNRLKCIDDIKAKVGVPVELVTINNLAQWVSPQYPIHPAYSYLSAVHRADYLRCYFMHIHGGGYTDIKPQSGSWKLYFDKLAQSEALAIGYPELSNGVAEINNRQLYQLMNQNYDKLIGMGAFIFKPNTNLTKMWLERLNHVLDNKLGLLKQHPASDPRDFNGKIIDGKISEYPLAWTELLGQILQPLIFCSFSDKILKSLPAPSFDNYI